LSRANTHLENARNTKDRRQAQKFCDDAKKALERIDIIKSIKDRDQIEAAYREHGKLLERLGLRDEAQTSYSKADELIGTAGRSTPVPPSNAAMAPTSTPSSAIASNSAFSSSSTTVRNKKTVIPTIFTEDCPPPVIQCALPGPDERLVSTRQLAFCLALLQSKPFAMTSLNSSARVWLVAVEKNQDEKERLRAMATDLIRALVRDELKDRMAIAEVVCLAPVLEKGDFWSLLSLFVNSIKGSLLLDVQTLEGLTHLIQSATPGYIDADDLVKILELLNTRLQETFQQSPQHIYELTITVSRVLDAMADSNIQGLDRVKLHEPLLSYLGRLKASKDPYIVYQAAYTFQALLCVPDDEEPWQAALRRSVAVVKGVGGLASAIKGLNVAEFINGLSTIQEGFKGAGQIFGLVQDAYNGVTALKDSGQGLLESLKNGLSFSHKRTWYAALRGADTLMQNGELTKFKTLVCEAPCRRDLAFQWGICQRLEYLASDPVWDDVSRKDAISFLGEMYWNDEEWGQEPRIKQCILDILLRLSQAPGHGIKGSMHIAAENLLRDLSTEGNRSKQALYLACIQIGATPHSWKVAMPLPDSSSLIDQVQNKPSVEPALREYQSSRLQEQEQRHSVYIPPQAKASRESSDDDLFDLTIKVNEFISDDGDTKVLLLLGDSGAGKSTFNLELEKNLWKAYNTDKKWIPVFVTLPAIDKPEEDLISKQLRRYGFTEAQIRELKSYYQFVLICDGYDECQKMNNLYNDNRLNQPREWKVKMVISCRSEYLGSDYRVLFQPGGRNDRRGATRLQEAVVAPFTITKIKDYVRSYVTNYHSGGDNVWKVEDYESAIRNIPNLQELVRNPFMLSLALEVVPRLVDLSKDFTSSRISRVTLYDQFVEQWVERGQIRLTERSLTGEDHAEFKMLLADGFTRNAIGFIKDLAVAIFDKQDGKPVVEYSPIRDKASWKTVFFGDGSGKSLLRETCPLSRTGNQYRFIHRSVLEYGLARAIFEPNPSGVDPDGSVEQLDVQQWIDQGELSVDTPSGSALFRKSFVHEPSIITFLSERVQQCIEFENQLHRFIDRSKTDRRFNQAAANAITILVRAGVRFNGADLKGIQIPGANLSGGDFDSAQLQGSDLSNTILRNVWLRRADLSNSRMDGVKFGQYPYLEMGSAIGRCVFSPDGKQLIVGLRNGSICVYSTSTWGDLGSTLSGHTDAVSSVAFSLTGHQIVSGSWDKTVRLWDAQTGEHVSTLSGHTGKVLCVAYSPTGRQIVSGGEDKTVRLWDAKTGNLATVLSGHTDEVRSVAYSPTGKHIVSSSGGIFYFPSEDVDETVRLWDAQSGELCSTLSGHTSTAFSVTYSPSGHQISTGSNDDTVELWDVQTGELASSLRGHSGIVYSVAYSPTGHQIASGSFDNTVRLWDAQTGDCVSTLSSHTSAVNSVAYSPNGQKIASGSWDKTVRLWDAQTGEIGSTLGGHTGGVRSLVYSPTTKQIASGSKDTTVRLWDAQTGELVSTFNGHTGYVSSVAYSPTGRQFASASLDNTVRLWDAQTSTPVSTLSGHTSGVSSVAYSPSGHRIASGSYDSTVRLWDTQNGELASTMIGHTSVVLSVAYSPSGQQIASGSCDETVRLWDAQTGTLSFCLCGHTEYVNSVSYSPSSQQIASGSRDKTVRLWDVSSGQCLFILDDFQYGFESVAWMSILNVTYLVTGCEDKSIRSWKLVEDGGNFQLVLHWRSSPQTLVLSNSTIQGVQGLSNMNTRLFLQHQAVGQPATP
ncbi:hypothetical protein BG011_009463, partial [Mortierella polycephala]